MMTLAAATIADQGGTVQFLQRPDGGQLRYAWFQARTAQSRRPVLFLTGYAEFMEKQLEVIGQLAQRGHSVVLMDWRGQGLSSRHCDDPQKGWIDCFETHLDDLDAMLADCFSATASVPRFLVLGHSMGGHLALRFAHRRPENCDRLVLSAPMIDIRMMLWQKALVGWFVGLMIRLNQGRTYILGGGPQTAKNRRFEGNPLTSDAVRFGRIFELIDGDPRLAVGAPTYDWVQAARASIKKLVSPGFAEAITMPVLMAIAGQDRIVNSTASARLLKRLAQGNGLFLKTARHEVMLECDAIRQLFWAAFDDFTADDLSAALGPNPLFEQCWTDK